MNLSQTSLAPISRRRQDEGFVKPAADGRASTVPVMFSITANVLPAYNSIKLPLQSKIRSSAPQKARKISGIWRHGSVNERRVQRWFGKFCVEIEIED